jgi:hypothetical protein
VLFDFHLRNARRVQGKYPLDALAVRDATHGKSFVEPAPLPADHYAGKDLDSFLVSFHDARVHAHAVPNRKRCGIAFLLFFLDRIDDLIHKLVASRAAAGAHCHSKAPVLQPEIAHHLTTSKKHEQEQENAQKICENLRDLWLIPVLMALVAQLDRALASGAKGCGFDPRRAQVP